ncbi:heme exporter protein CcmD [Aliidiomarina halalkaliphila]|uniref:Heme exporter protein D n=1 Tax=Aliidiomarina halalkaliphila TaxID=2593535 RepID=A0A552X5H9_9GAMM|nr:heme exporter protein CcmD [Aliidiomarina halalkaliphila]TRW50274.1 heme exporter protein CcmD [Aliidiomarina halalkaliphila]
MQFDSWSAFIAMGGYGVYVWSAFFVTFLCFGLLALEAVWRRTKLRDEARKQQARQQRIEKAKRES